MLLPYNRSSRWSQMLYRYFKSTLWSLAALVANSLELLICTRRIEKSMQSQSIVFCLHPRWRRLCITCGQHRARRTLLEHTSSVMELIQNFVESSNQEPLLVVVHSITCYCQFIGFRSSSWIVMSSSSSSLSSSWPNGFGKLFSTSSISTSAVGIE